MILQASQFEYEFPRPALVMGIVNVTPDSFSDGGQFLAPGAAVAHALDMVARGADILDVGGESTRPHSEPVPEEEELRRVLPVIEELARKVKTPISIDTMKVGVAREALKAGASLVNDVGASRAGPDMWRLVAETRAGYVCMHMQGTPRTMQLNPVYGDVVKEVGEFFSERLGQLHDCGVSPEQIILDPGIGFGKTRKHNLQLLAGLGAFSRFERPLLVGVSRKSFLGGPGGEDAGARLPAGLACACWALKAGVQMLRVHDVLETVQAVRMTEAILANQSE